MFVDMTLPKIKAFPIPAFSHFSSRVCGVADGESGWSEADAVTDAAISSALRMVSM